MFKKIETKDLGNPFEMIGKDWMLVTGSKEGEVNTLTASWGTFGHIWNKDVVSIYIRPQRRTDEFIRENETFTLTFFDKKYKKDLAHLGTVSGHEDKDKLDKTSISVVKDELYPYFNEANIVIKCKNIYKYRMDKSMFLDETLDSFYKDGDYHNVYVAEIVEVLKRDGE